MGADMPITSCELVNRLISVMHQYVGCPRPGRGAENTGAENTGRNMQDMKTLEERRDL